MSSDWKLSELGKEAINASRPFPFEKYKKVVFVNTGDVLSGKFLHSTISDSQGLPGQAKKALRQNDILLSEIRPGNGRFAYVDFDVSNYVVSTKFMVIESLGRVSARFLYHVLTNKSALNEFQRIAESRSGTFPQITFDSISHFPIPIPSVTEQAELVEFLDTLDNRINLLRETNKTLEAIAQAIFKSWFIDFDPVRTKIEGLVLTGMDAETAALFPNVLVESELGLIPKGWNVKTVGEVIETVGGATPDTKNFEYWEPAEHCWTSPKDLSGLADPILLSTERRVSSIGLARISSGLLPSGTLLMSSRAPIGYLAISDMPVAINQGYIAMPPGGPLPPQYMLYWCQQNMEGIKGRANGSTFMEISKKAFRPMPIILPPPKILDLFEKTSNTLFARLIVNAKQMQTLGEIRDTLLPRLISGKLRLADAKNEAASDL